MRKILLASILMAASASSALAGGYPHYHHQHGSHFGHHHHYHNNHAGKVALGILGGVVIASAIQNANRQVIVTQPQPVYTPQVAIQSGNCLVNIYNPYMNRYENVVVSCNQPVVQSVPQIIQ